MTEAEFEQFQKDGKVGFVTPPVAPPQKDTDAIPSEGYRPIIEALRRLKPHRTTAPDFLPMTLLDQIQFYDDGSNRRVYFYINKTWRYAALT
jgi:hypothetical protein